MTKRQEAIEAIRDLIFSGELTFGKKTSEREILGALKARGKSGLAEASRTPIREALSVLSYLGLVAQYPQVGVTVLEMTYEATERHLRLRSAIEAEVVRELIRRGPEQWEAALEIANGTVSNVESVRDLMDAETSFHSLLPELGGMEEARQSIRAYSDRLHLFRMQYATGTSTDEVNAYAAEHRAIADAVAGGSQSAAEAAIATHRDGILARLQSLTLKPAVSVLFADLVGFTTLSESRDVEEVRELLTRYFDTAAQIITRYGGTVEKFIGDAIMAVWGSPVAKEDDAKRAVRAALEMTQAVAALGEEVGAPDLKARAGVLTERAAVTLGAEGLGMAGDLVNIASRIQSVAEPGTVLVGEGTKRASEATVAYEKAGSFELKGKAEPVPLWRALRVIGRIRGASAETLARVEGDDRGVAQAEIAAAATRRP